MYNTTHCTAQFNLTQANDSSTQTCLPWKSEQHFLRDIHSWNS